MSSKRGRLNQEIKLANWKNQNYDENDTMENIIRKNNSHAWSSPEDLHSSFLQKLLFHGIKRGLQIIFIKLLHGMPSENVAK